MYSHHRLTRRDFLKLVGVAVSTVTLEACSAKNSPLVEPMPAFTPTANPEIPVPDMILVDAGQYEMGSKVNEFGDSPVHPVTISRPFFIGRYEVTFDQYDAFCDDAKKGKPQDFGRGRADRPTVDVTWYDAIAYCNWLSGREGLLPCYSGRGKNSRCDFTANGFRLPTEAEWEYAACGGPKSESFKYAGSNNPDEAGWYIGNSKGQAQPVGQKEPNGLGLYDVSGNVWEWCWDWYAADYYDASPASDPTGPGRPEGQWNQNRVRRGGCFEENSDTLKVAYRSFDLPTLHVSVCGFRVARNA